MYKQRRLQKHIALVHEIENMEGKRHTRKIGCFNANFSTPPLIMDVLRVMIPAYTYTHTQNLPSNPFHLPSRLTGNENGKTYHLDSTTERQLSLLTDENVSDRQRCVLGGEMRRDVHRPARNANLQPRDSPHPQRRGNSTVSRARGS